MSVSIERVCEPTNELLCTSSSTTSPPFGFGNVAGGLIFCISATAADGTTALTTITVHLYAHWSHNVAASQLADSTNAIVTMTLQPGRCYELPSALFGAVQVRVVAATANQTCRIRFIGKT